MRYRFIVGIGLLIVIFVIIASCFSKTETITLEDQNMDIVRLSICAFGDGDWATFTDLHSPAYIQHATDSMDPITWGEYILSCSVAHKRIPDLKYRIDDIFAVNDRVAVRSTWQYRNDSEQFKQQFPNGVVLGTQVGIFEVMDGKIIEEWGGCSPLMNQRFFSIGRMLNVSR